MKETTTEDELVQKILDGNDKAVEELLGRYLKPVYNFIYRITNDRISAEDIAQDTFIKLWKNLSRFDRSKNLKTWIFTIAKNTAFDYLKKKKEIPFSNFTDDEGENWLENSADENILPDEILDEPYNTIKSRHQRALVRLRKNILSNLRLK